MIKLLALAIILSTIICCAPAEKKKYQVPEELEKFVTRFEEFGSMEIDNLVVGYDDLKGDRLGECRYGKTPTVVLDIAIKDRSDIYLEIVMFHELGHCILGRDHNEELSIMNTYKVQDYIYVMNYSAYISELFGIEFVGDYEPY